MEDEYVNTKKAKELLQITPKTLRIWDKEGKIRTFRTPSGQRRYYLKDIQNIMGRNSSHDQKQKVCYCRISSTKQMDDLSRQTTLLKSKFPNHILVTDVGSGINWNRKGLKTILDKAMHRTISEVVVAHRDQLCRFAFELLEWILQQNGVKLLVLDEENGKSSDKELSDDILSIIHLYSCRQMGKRRYKIKETTSLPNSGTKENHEELDVNQEICLQ